MCKSNVIRKQSTHDGRYTPVRKELNLWCIEDLLRVARDQICEPFGLNGTRIARCLHSDLSWISLQHILYLISLQVRSLFNPTAIASHWLNNGSDVKL